MSIRSTIEAQLEQLSPRDKKLITGLLIFFGIGALTLLTMTLVGLQRSLEADVRAANDTLIAVREHQRTYDVAAAQLEAQKARLAQFDGTALSAHVESLAQQLGIAEGLRDAQRLEQVEENGVQLTKWKVVLKGRTYDEAVQFILQLENSGYPLRVENARFRAVSVKREPAVDLTLDIHTFRLLEDT